MTRASDRRPVDVLNRLKLAQAERRGTREATRGEVLLVRADGSFDVECLERAIERLGEIHPEITARLVRTRNGKAHWRFTGEKARLRTHQTGGADDEEVLAIVEELSESGIRVEEEDPIRFHLLRREGGGDLLAMKFSLHLLDGKGPDRLLEELSRLAAGEDAATPGEEEEMEEPLRRYLDLFPRRERWRAGLEDLLGTGRRIRRSRARGGRHLRLLPRSAVAADAPVRFVARTVPVERTEAFLARVRGLFGFENPAPAIVASALRAAVYVSAEDPRPDDVGRTSIPVGLWNLARVEVPIFVNLAVHLPVEIPVAEMGDRDRLAKRIGRELRRALAENRELGRLQAAWWLRHRELWSILRLGIRGMGRPSDRGMTVGFNHKGRFSPSAERLCGADVEEVHQIPRGSSGTPLLLTGLCADRLNVSLALAEPEGYEGLAERYVDALIEDLVSETGLRLDEGGKA